MNTLMCTQNARMYKQHTDVKEACTVHKQTQQTLACTHNTHTRMHAHTHAHTHALYRHAHIHMHMPTHAQAHIVANKAKSKYSPNIQ